MIFIGTRKMSIIFISTIYLFTLINFSFNEFVEDRTTVARGKRQSKSDCGLLEELLSEEKSCYISNIAIACPASAVTGVVLMKRCRPFYTKDQVTTVSYLCDNGRWILLDTPCEPECGVKDGAVPRGRIGPQNPYPWIVSIYQRRHQISHCSGSIISPYYVITATGCIGNDWRNSKLIVAAGRLYYLDKASQNRKVKNVITHPDFHGRNPGPIKYDMQLLELEEPFEFSSGVLPICIDWDSTYEASDFKNGTLAESSIVNDLRYAPPYHVEVTFEYLDRETCAKQLDSEFARHYTDEKFCVLSHLQDTVVDYTAIGKGLFFKSDGNRYHLKGIQSGIRMANQTGKHILYSRVSNFVPWIKDQIGFVLRNKDQSGCILPSNGAQGSFSMADQSNYIQNTLVSPSTIIFFTCSNTGDERKTNGTDEVPRTVFLCLQNEWFPSIDEATCIKTGTCPSKGESISEKISCNLNGSPVDCDIPTDNTTAIVRCKPFFTFEGLIPIYKCQNGTWDQEFTSCSPECGKQRANSSFIGGKVIPQSAYPWVAAIYNTENNQICSGSIISRNFVLSAAQCFTENKDNYTLIAGKYYRDLNVNESNSQRRKIKSLIIHEDYAGNYQLYRFDLALVELDEALTLSTNVQPVCMDWSTIYEEFDFTHKSEGVSAGWGVIQECQPPSSLQTTLPSLYWSKLECLKQLPEEYSRDFRASDKICVGYKEDGPSVFQGDIGSGLYFRSDGKKFYIRGIASTTIKTNTGGNSKYYTMYTKISKYIQWIEDKTRIN